MNLRKVCSCFFTQKIPKIGQPTSSDDLLEKNPSPFALIIFILMKLAEL